MSRKEEVEKNTKVLAEELEKVFGLDLMQEQVMNLNLSVIAQELSEISITLAMIVDQLTSTNGSGTAESETKKDLNYADQDTLMSAT